MRSRLWLPILVVWATACTRDRPVTTGFYHWKTRFAPDSVETLFLKQTAARTLYLRIFDVDWDFQHHRPIPKAILQTSGNFPADVRIIPTVFITNRCLRHTTRPDSMAIKIITLARDVLGADLAHRFPVLQLDADWSGSTRDTYFRLIRAIRRLGNFERISVTIRLHQYKYPEKTGVPPADEGILMCYNTGNIEDPDETNSIATPSTVKAYLNGPAPYPIPLGVALPLYRWTVIYRDGRLFKIVSNPDTSWTADSSHFGALGAHRYVVVHNTFFFGHFLYTDDLLRIEQVPADSLREMLQMLRQKQYFREVVWYHLDRAQLAAWTPDLLNDLANAPTSGHKTPPY